HDFIPALSPFSSISSISVSLYIFVHHLAIHSFPTRRSSDLSAAIRNANSCACWVRCSVNPGAGARTSVLMPLRCTVSTTGHAERSEEHTSELQSRENLVCRLLLEKKKDTNRLLTSSKESLSI